MIKVDFDISSKRKKDRIRQQANRSGRLSETLEESKESSPEAQYEKLPPTYFLHDSGLTHNNEDVQFRPDRAKSFNITTDTFSTLDDSLHLKMILEIYIFNGLLILLQREDANFSQYKS